MGRLAVLVPDGARRFSLVPGGSGPSRSVPPGGSEGLVRLGQPVVSDVHRDGTGRAGRQPGGRQCGQGHDGVVGGIGGGVTTSKLTDSPDSGRGGRPEELRGEVQRADILEAGDGEGLEVELGAGGLVEDRPGAGSVGDDGTRFGQQGDQEGLVRSSTTGLSCRRVTGKGFDVSPGKAKVRVCRFIDIVLASAGDDAGRGHVARSRCGRSQRTGSR